MNTVSTRPPNASAARPDIYHDALLGPDAIAQAVRRDGVVVFPGFVDAEALPRLNAEFDAVMAAPESHGHHTDRDKGLLNVRTTVDRLQAAGAPTMAETFSQDFMGATTKAYFDTQDVVTNREVFINRNQHHPEPIDRPPFLLHFDKREVFKFFIYLTDTNFDNGGMRIVVGSPDANRSLRRRRLEASGGFDRLDNVLSEYEDGAVVIDGPPGTLFVFTTDAAHGAGFVQPGYERRIARGHCYSRALLSEMGMA